MNTQAFGYARQFTDNAFKAQAALLKGFEQMAALQLKTFEAQAEQAGEFANEAFQAHDANSLRQLWDKGSKLHRAYLEQSISAGQEMLEIAQQTAQDVSALAVPPVTAAAPKKTASKAA